MEYRQDLAQVEGLKWDKAQGVLTGQVKIMRVGVLPYLYPDGTIHWELKHPDDFRSAAFLASLNGRPVTDGHPPQMINEANLPQFSKGMIFGKPSFDGNFTRMAEVIVDPTLQKSVQAGQKAEVSTGIYTDVVDETGTYDGVAYDKRQTNPSLNHLAQVPQGRCGGGCKIKLDEMSIPPDTAIQLAPEDIPQPERDDNMTGLSEQLGLKREDLDTLGIYQMPPSNQRSGDIYVNLIPLSSFDSPSLHYVYLRKDTVNVPGMELFYRMLNGVDTIVGDFAPGVTPPANYLQINEEATLKGQSDLKPIQGFVFAGYCGWTPELAKQWLDARFGPSPKPGQLSSQSAADAAPLEGVRADATVVNAAGLAQAKSLIAAGKVNKTAAWSFKAADGNKLLGPAGSDWTKYGLFHLAKVTGAVAHTKAAWAFPYGKDGQVYRSGVIAAKQRAAQVGLSAVSNAAGSLLLLIDAKKSAAIEPTSSGTTNDDQRKLRGETMETFMLNVLDTRLEVPICDKVKVEDLKVYQGKVDEMIVGWRKADDALKASEDAQAVVTLKTQIKNKTDEVGRSHTALQELQTKLDELKSAKTDESAEQIKQGQVELQAKADALKQTQTDLEKLQGELAGKQTVIDKLSEKLEQIEQKVDSRSDVISRSDLKLASQLTKVLPGFEWNGESRREMQVLAVKAVKPEFDPEGKGDAYLDGMFESVLDLLTAAHQQTAGRSVGANYLGFARGDGQPDPAQKQIQDNLQKRRNLMKSADDPEANKNA